MAQVKKNYFFICTIAVLYFFNAFPMGRLLEINSSPAIEKSQLKDTILKQGIQLESSKQYQKAVQLYQRYLNKHPKRADLWLRIADIEQSFLNNPQAAAKAYAEIAKLRPKNATIAYELARRYLIAKQNQLALN